MIRKDLQGLLDQNGFDNKPILVTDGDKTAVKNRETLATDMDLVGAIRVKIDQARTIISRVRALNPNIKIDDSFLSKSPENLIAHPSQLSAFDAQIDKAIQEAKGQEETDLLELAGSALNWISGIFSSDKAAAPKIPSKEELLKQQKEMLAKAKKHPDHKHANSQDKHINDHTVVLSEAEIQTLGGLGYAGLPNKGKNSNGLVQSDFG